jgi:photosystem II stability/assembly factor-like uncharacterized protein
MAVTWEMQESGLEASLRGLSAVDELTAWISGSGGSYAFTRDGGLTWNPSVVPGADSLDFRDVEAFPDGTAYLMSAGSGPQSRIFKTEDWGASWTEQHVNPVDDGFFNGMAFWDQSRGMVVGDPIDGTLFLLFTADGGESWERLQGPDLPEVREGEYGFAASGTNIATFGDQGLTIVSGGSAARVFRTADGGRSWQVADPGFTRGAASKGMFSVAYRGEQAAVIVGGDYQLPQESGGNVAFSTDGGLTWSLTPDPHGVGFRSAVTWVVLPDHSMWIAVGTSGSSYSTDDGESWTEFDRRPFNAVAFACRSGWAAGPDGGVAKLLIR